MKAPPPPSALLAVRVKPNHKRPGIVLDGDTVEVRVRERPVEGSANDAVRAALAQALGIAPSRIELARGARAREKAWKISGLSYAEALARLREAAGGGPA